MLVLSAALVLFQAYLFFWRASGTPSTTAGERRMLGEVAGAVTAIQTFEMDANGLEAITIYAAESDRVRGPVVFELAELTDARAAPVTLFRDSRDAAASPVEGPSRGGSAPSTARAANSTRSR